MPFYVALLDGPEGLRLLDVQSTAGFAQHIVMGSGTGLDLGLAILFFAILLGGLYLGYRYITGLHNSPREIWFLFFTKVTEYSAYGAANLAFMFYLRNDMGMSDMSAGSYYAAWSTSMTLLTMVVGAVCDAIGVKRTLLIGAVCLMLSRAVMPFTDSLLLATLLGFLPLAVGTAITGHLYPRIWNRWEVHEFPQPPNDLGATRYESLKFPLMRDKGGTVFVDANGPKNVRLFTLTHTFKVQLYSRRFRE